MKATTNHAVYEELVRYERRQQMVRYVLIMLFAGFAYWTIDHLDVPIERMADMFGRIRDLIVNRMMPPDLAHALRPSILASVVETIEMTILGTFVGSALSVVIAWWAAWNVTPSRYLLFPLGRGLLIVSRAVPALIWAMVLVTIFGFGPLAGVLTIILITIGFAAKLMAEQVEAIDMGPVEALVSTGASRTKVFIFSIFPQVRPAWAGILVYNWDTAFRASTVLGFVGAGGLGLHIRVAIQELQYQHAMGMFVIIILLVVGSEFLSHFVRSRLR